MRREAYSKFPSKIAKKRLNMMKLPTRTSMMKKLIEEWPVEIMALYIT